MKGKGADLRGFASPLRRSKLLTKTKQSVLKSELEMTRQKIKRRARRYKEAKRSVDGAPPFVHVGLHLRKIPSPCTYSVAAGGMRACTKMLG